jgi:hypothetical protein
MLTLTFENYLEALHFASTLQYAIGGWSNLNIARTQDGKFAVSISQEIATPPVIQ